MLRNIFSGVFASALVLGFVVAVSAQTPKEPIRKYVVMKKQSLAELEKKLSGENKAEDLVGGEGMYTRVAIQHDKEKVGSEAESHDDSDDVYYVLEGEAELTLGGKLDNPREISKGEWRAKSITGGQTMIIKKGDLIVVPRGTPHQRNTTAKKNFSLILVKVFLEPIKAAK